MLLLIASVFVVSMAMPRNPMASPFQVQPDAVVPSMETAAFSTNGQFMNMDVDGVIPDYFNKKTEKMPMQKRRKDILFLSSMPEDSSFGFADVPEHFDINEQQPGVAPQMTGSVSQPQSDEFYNFGESQEAISNPAATYLEGGDFDKIKAPKCQMSGCVGPVPNDGTLSIDIPQQSNQACHQTFVPMNGCTDNKGYPMGMLCSICCDCTNDFKQEMKKTFGYKQGYVA